MSYAKIKPQKFEIFHPIQTKVPGCLNLCIILISAGFQWNDKSTVNFINWENGQPSGSTQRGNQENCVEIMSWNGMWNDIDCSQLRSFVCVQSQSR